MRSAISDVHVLVSYTSWVFGDLTRDPLHTESIHPVIGEATIIPHNHRTITRSSATLSTNLPPPIRERELYITGASCPPKILFSPLEDLNAYLNEYF